MKKDKKDHPVLFALLFSSFMLFIVFPILAWQSGWNRWSRMYDKKRKS